jgi:hypothetical protein
LTAPVCSFLFKKGGCKHTAETCKGDHVGCPDQGIICRRQMEDRICDKSICTFFHVDENHLDASKVSYNENLDRIRKAIDEKVSEAKPKKPVKNAIDKNFVKAFMDFKDFISHRDLKNLLDSDVKFIRARMNELEAILKA